MTAKTAFALVLLVTTTFARHIRTKDGKQEKSRKYSVRYPHPVAIQSATYPDCGGSPCASHGVYQSSHSAYHSSYPASHQQSYPASHQQSYPASYQQSYSASHQQSYPASYQQASYPVSYQQQLSSSHCCPTGGSSCCGQQQSPPCCLTIQPFESKSIAVDAPSKVTLQINILPVPAKKPEPSTSKPSTPKPRSPKPSTPKPSTQRPSTPKPSTPKPTTAEPATAKPTTAEPTTAEPTTAEPTTAVPTTAEPSTAIPTTSNPTTAVPTTAKPGGTNKYTFVDADVTWEDARVACRNMNAHLVTMETIAEWIKVRTAIAERVRGDTRNHHWFIGLSRKHGTWRWSEEPEGVAKGTLAVNDTRWQLDEPSNSFPEPCGEIQSNYRGQRGHINNVICNKKPSRSFARGYICEHEL